MEIHPQKQRERLNYLEFKVFFSGRIGRGDLVSRFGISEAAATRDLAIYREEAPANIELDHSAKVYRIQPTFRLHYLRDVDPKVLFRAVVHGMGDDFGTDPAPVVPCELPIRLNAPNLYMLAAVSRAVCQEKVLRVVYLSANGENTRELVPFSFAGNGLRWHVRAFDRLRGRFSDFVINRIVSADVVEHTKPKSNELRSEDEQWNRIVHLEIAPHPRYQHKKMVEVEYGMVEGVVKIKTRAALAGYVLKLWNVDCSPDQSAPSAHCQLYLRNPMAIYGVENAEIAKGG